MCGGVAILIWLVGLMNLSMYLLLSFSQRCALLTRSNLVLKFHSWLPIILQRCSLHLDVLIFRLNLPLVHPVAL